MAKTPEGRVKERINETLAQYEGCWVYMPVPMGFGKRTLDYLLCFRGLFVAIEAKAPGKEPTKLQYQTIGEITAAGGKVFVVDGEESLAVLNIWLNRVNETCTSAAITSR